MSGNCYQNETYVDLQVLSRLAAQTGQTPPDLINPQDYVGFVDTIKKSVGFSSQRAAVAMSVNWSQPWTVYPEAVLDANLFTPVAVGQAVSLNALSGGMTFSWPGGAVSQIHVGDVVYYSGSVFQIPYASTISASASNSGLGTMGGSLPPASANAGTWVVVARPRIRDPKTVPYALGSDLYHLKHQVSISLATSNSVIFYYSDVSWNSNWYGAFSTSDALIYGGVVYPLTGCSFSATGTSVYGTGCSTNFSALSGLTNSAFVELWGPENQESTGDYYIGGSAHAGTYLTPHSTPMVGISQTAALGSTTILTTPGAGLYWIETAAMCNTTVASATVTPSCSWTGTDNIVHTITASAATCTTLGSNSATATAVDALVKAGTAITCSTAVSGSPNYDVRAVATERTVQ
jgi:hypothetical protein